MTNGQIIINVLSSIIGIDTITEYLSVIEVKGYTFYMSFNKKWWYEECKTPSNVYLPFQSTYDFND